MERDNNMEAKERIFMQEGATVEVKYKNIDYLLEDYEEMICNLISLFMSYYCMEIDEVIDTINNGGYLSEIIAKKDEE